jgi:hypothetical protein
VIIPLDPLPIPGTPPAPILPGEDTGPGEAPTPVGSGVVAIPEPGSWMLLISGFGFVGLALRRRRAFGPGRVG